MDTVLLLGNGGREHAWALAISKSGARIVTWAPILNPGIEDLAEITIVAPYEKDPELISEWIAEINLAIIGPEKPLVSGMADWLKEQGIDVFSPSKANARLEGSKSYLRSLLSRYGISGNIPYAICKSEKDLRTALKNNLKVAIKPDGLTGGKGVKVYGDHFRSMGEAIRYGVEMIKKDGKVLLEEKITGIEFSLQGLVHGENIVFLPLVRDFKRAYDGDKGPNTGSMGAVSYPNHGLPFISKEDLDSAKGIVREVLKALQRENGAYVGAIYGQFMLTEKGPKVIEFNARLGDPEAINTLALLETSLLKIIEQLKVGSPKVNFMKKATCVVYLVPEGYPESPAANVKFEIPEEIMENIHFASVRREGESYFTSSSRSLAIISIGNNLQEARTKLYDMIEGRFSHLKYRSDIGQY